MPQPIMKKYKQGEMGMEYGMPSKEKIQSGTIIIHLEDKICLTVFDAIEKSHCPEYLSFNFDIIKPISLILDALFSEIIFLTANSISSAVICFGR